MLPELKKRITSFFVGEDGKVSKQGLLSLGAFLSVGVLGGILASKDVDAQTVHTNDLGLSYSGDAATATHSHHSSHTSNPCTYPCGGPCTPGPGPSPCTGGPCSGCGPCCGACACS